MQPCLRGSHAGKILPEDEPHDCSVRDLNAFGSTGRAGGKHNVCRILGADLPRLRWDR